MKKYNIKCGVGSWNLDRTIECDYFSFRDSSGSYYFHNSETGEEWWFPVMHTVVKRIINK